MNKPTKITTKGKVLRCPNCGASKAAYDVDAGGLRCENCRTVFVSPKINELGGVDELVGEIRGSGANDLVTDDFVMSLRCPSCGANIMVDKDAKDIHCHWCRHNLTTRDKIPNGEMPDLVLPFKLQKKDALRRMRKFSSKRQFFSAGGFGGDLSERTIKGVYLPYVVVDVNAKVELEGSAERTIGMRIVNEYYNDNDDGSLKTVYDVNVYDVSRSFNLRIDDLTIEASRNKFERGSLVNTTHIVNAIMPFDTEEAVEWDPRYLKGFSSEKRDLNIEDLEPRLRSQVYDIARRSAMKTTTQYDRGVRWDKAKVDIVGIKWKTAYFPVWIYSHVMPGPGGKNAIHYMAVNARTGETMGSVPLRSWMRTVIVGVPFVVAIGFLISLFINHDRTFAARFCSMVVFALFTWFLAKRMKAMSREYINNNARHMYELDTCILIDDMAQSDKLANALTRDNKGMIYGYNEERMTGAHNYFISEDEMESATGIKTVTYIKVVSYIIIGLFLAVIFSLLALLLGSVANLVG